MTISPLVLVGCIIVIYRWYKMKGLVENPMEKGNNEI